METGEAFDMFRFRIQEETCLRRKNITTVVLKLDVSTAYCRFSCHHQLCEQGSIKLKGAPGNFVLPCVHCCC